MNETMEQTVALPHEIIIDEILVRLPVKSLCRFKSVSKLWKSVISSTQFAKSHLKNHSKSNTKRVFFHHHGTAKLLDYEAYDDDQIEDQTDRKGFISLNPRFNELRAADVFGSSCGLVCWFNKPGQVCLCNPVLQQHRLISTPEPSGPDVIILRGFGYVESIDDFRVFLGFRDPFGNPTTMYVFSLRNYEWRRIGGVDNKFSVIASSNVDNSNGVLINGRLHWWSPGSGRIFAFDLVDEVFWEVQIPDFLSFKATYMFDSLKSSGLASIRGFLCLSVLWEDYNMEIWMLNEYNDMDSWIRLYDLRLMSCYNYQCRNFFGCTKTGKLLISCENKESRYGILFLVDMRRPYYPKLNPIWQFWGGGATTVVEYDESLLSPLGFVTRKESS